MANGTIENKLEEREEGEIIEDEFEDVSDDSISPNPPLYYGKSVTRELIRAVSLSSDSDYKCKPTRCENHFLRIRTERQNYHNYPRSVRQKRKLEHHSSRSIKHKHVKHRRKSVGSSSDSDSERADARYLQQLKEAVRINTSAELIPNNLESRLKGMTQKASVASSEDDHEIEELRKFALLSKIQSKKGEDISRINKSKVAEDNDALDDTELIELRLEALKSAMLKKHEDRKQKQKALVEKNKSCSANETDKENTHDLINKDLDVCCDNKSCPRKPLNVVEASESPVTDICTDIVNDLVNVVVDSIEMDVSKLDNKNVESVNNSSIEEDTDILRAMLLASMSNKITSQTAEISQQELNRILPSAVQKSSKRNATFLLKKNVYLNKLQYVLPNKMQAKKNTTYTLNNKVTNNKVINKPQVQPLMMKPVKPLIININNESDSDVDDLEPKNSKETVLKESISQFLKKQRAEVENQTTSTSKPIPKQTPAKKQTKDSPPRGTIDNQLMEKSAMKLLPQSQQLEYRNLKLQLLNAHKKPRNRKLSLKLEKVSPTSKGAKVKGDSPKANELTRSAQKERALYQAAVVKKTLDDLQTNKNGRLQMKGKYRSLLPLLNQLNKVDLEKKLQELEIKRLLQELQKTRTKHAISVQNYNRLVKIITGKKEAIDWSAGKNATGNVYEPKVAATVNSTENCSKAPPAGAVHKNPAESNCGEKEDAKVAETIPNCNEFEKGCIRYTSLLDSKVRTLSPINPLVEICPYDLSGVCKDKECPYKHIS